MRLQTRIRIDAALTAAGIPHWGTSGELDSLVVNFRPEATQTHRNAVAGVVSAFDPSPAADAAAKVAAEANLADFRDQTTAMQTELEADLVVAQNSATNLNQLRAVVRNQLQRERRTLKAVRRLIDVSGLL